MKILITADLHYDISRSKASARDLARKAVEEGGDALVLVGDTAGADLPPLKECLGLFAGFGGRKLLVPGNHCLWCRAGQTSIERYERIIPEAAAEMGFAVLDHTPVVMEEIRDATLFPAGGKTPECPSPSGNRVVSLISGEAQTVEIGDTTPFPATGNRVASPISVGLAGTVGWYDYSFADESLGLPVDFYRAKVAPGAARFLGDYEDILERHRDRLTDRHYGMGSHWMDGVHVKLGMSDEEFLDRLCRKLRSQLDDLSRRAERIVVFTHHVPFSELVPRGRPDRFAFAAAYMGSPKLGEVILEFPKVTHVYCGHSHWPGRIQVGRVSVVNVGSTYTDKKLEILEL
jgi:Icc-related predicted phosphoesterase